MKIDLIFMIVDFFEKPSFKTRLESRFLIS